MDELFIGSAVCEVTNGGEIVLPRHFHETIMSRSPDSRLFVGLHEESPCLVVYDRIFAAQQQWDFDTRRSTFLGTNMDVHYARVRRAFGFVEHVTLAPDGMMILPTMMRERGRIANSALLVATGQRFEIWDLDMVLERGPSDLISLAMLHLKLRVSNEESHGTSLQTSASRHHTKCVAQPGLRVQQVPALRPRHDPIGGVGNEQMEGRAAGISGHLEKY